MEQSCFEKRLERFNLNDTQREKYLNINSLLQSAHAKAKEDLKNLAEHISFAGFVKGLRLVLTDKEISRGKSALCLVPVCATDNLMDLRKLDAARPAPQLQSIGIITVYEAAEADEEPRLTTLDVLAQIPTDLVGKVSAFCLRLEEKFAVNGYNLIAKAYEYKVELYS